MLKHDPEVPLALLVYNKNNSFLIIQNRLNSIYPIIYRFASQQSHWTNLINLKVQLTL